MAKRTAVQVEGLKDVMAAVDKLNANASKAIAEGLQKVPKEVADKTRRRVPGQALSGWGGWSRTDSGMSGVGALRFDKTDIDRKIKVLSGGKRMNVRLVNQAASGAVFETAGRRNPGSQFNQALANRWGPAPRLLIRTWREERGVAKTASAVGREMRKAENLLRRAGGS